MGCQRPVQQHCWRMGHMVWVDSSRLTVPMKQAKEALERRRMERQQEDQRMRRPWQEPPPPKKEILRAKQKKQPVRGGVVLGHSGGGCW